MRLKLILFGLLRGAERLRSKKLWEYSPKFKVFLCALQKQIQKYTFKKQPQSIYAKQRPINDTNKLCEPASSYRLFCHTLDPCLLPRTSIHTESLLFPHLSTALSTRLNRRPSCVESLCLADGSLCSLGVHQKGDNKPIKTF